MTSTPSSRPDCAGLPDTDGEWVFDWSTAAVGMFQREQNGWVMRGRPNASPDTGWVVAHDVFHHRPGDTGTYAEEVMTFGAEAWLDLDDGPDALGKSLSTSWFSVMALVVENGTRGVEGVVISRPANLEGSFPRACTEGEKRCSHFWVRYDYRDNDGMSDKECAQLLMVLNVDFEVQSIQRNAMTASVAENLCDRNKPASSPYLYLVAR